MLKIYTSFFVIALGLDECQLGTDTCNRETEDCLDTPWTFLCLCKSGFVFEDGKCRDINECQMSALRCPALSGCVNTLGSYECRCMSGYQMDDLGQCVDTDECQWRPCDNNATCRNFLGSFSCTCNEYYSGSGLTCEPIDECSTGSHNCHADADCLDVEQGFECTCRDGFDGDGINCFDIDECTEDDACMENSICNNTHGSFSCSCANGYTKRGQLCINIDECSLGEVQCQSNSKCVDTNGSYECHCDEGFEQLTSGHCSDIDECLDRTDDCNYETQKCVNLVGSYKCETFDCTELADSAMLECSRSGVVRILFPPCVYAKFDMSSWYLGGPEANSNEPLSRECYEKQDHETGWFYWHTQVNDGCATSKVDNGTHLVYTNTVQKVADFGSNRVITRLRGSVITFSCVYALDDVSMTRLVDVNAAELVNLKVV